ncbi:MAG: transposase [Candidatus Entotheonellia bacterium]
MLRPMPIGPIPSETARVARAAFPKGNRYRCMADALETRCTDDAFLALFPVDGPPAHPPWRLALVTIRHFAEGRSDRQAAHAVRRRIDWQYVLRLERTDPGFDASGLSAFRARLIAGAAESLLFETWPHVVSPPPARQGKGSAAHRRHAYSGGRAGIEPDRGGRRNDAARPQSSRHHGPGVVAHGEPLGMEGPRCAAGRG